MAAFNSFTHISRGWCSRGDDEGMTEHTRTGHGRWGSHVAPPTLLTLLLLWQWHMAFPCVCNSFPQELQVFCNLVTFLWFYLPPLTLPLKHRLGCWGYSKCRKEGQRLPERWGSCRISPERCPHCWRGDGRGWGASGAASLEESSHPAGMTKENSSCRGIGNQLVTQELILCLWDTEGGKEEAGWPGNAHKMGKRNGISRQEWVLIVSQTPMLMLRG